jgi:putative ABC transport system permease protein
MGVSILFRILWRNRFTTAINMLGLASGLAACLLIYLFIENEISYDRCHSKSDRIYRVSSEMRLSNQTDKFGYSSYNFGPYIKKEYPQIEEAVRVMPVRKQTMWVENEPFQFEDNFMADEGFFKVFDYQFLEGNPQNCLSEPGSVVITDAVAQRLFGKQASALGKVIQYAKRPYKVTGVVKDRVNQTHLHFNTLLSLNSIPPQLVETLSFDWFYLMQTTYLLFRTVEDGQQFTPRLRAFEAKFIAPWLKQNNLQASLKYHLEPLADIHLHSEFVADYADQGNSRYLRIFGWVAVFVLVIACINYLNMATATASKRAKEIGIRKTSGARAGSLFWQFLSESGITVSMSVLLAIALAWLLLPLFNQLAGKQLAFPWNLQMLGVLLVFLVITGLAAGAYPAFYLASLQPLQVLKSQKANVGSGQWLRKALVVFQFFISAGFIVCTLVVLAQLKFMKDADLGFQKEQILVMKVPTADTSFVNQFEVLKAELKQNPDILKVAGTSSIPGQGSGIILHFLRNAEGQVQEKSFPIMTVSHDFLDLMGMKLAKGRNFSRDYTTDDTAAFVVNEALVRSIGWPDPFSPHVENGLGYSGNIVGVVKDFHFSGLQSPIEPVIMMLDRKLSGYMLLKIRPGKEAQTLAFAENVWKKFSRKYPVESFFLDDHFNKQYRTEEKMGTLFSWFSGLSILISCLGLFALVTFSLEQRVKEIGIRKVLGANLQQIMVVVGSDFVKLIAIAMVLAFPVAAWSMHRWLEDFAHRINLNFWMFAGALVLVLLISVFTLLLKIIPAAQANPTEALRTE